MRMETSDINKGDVKVVELAVWFIRCPLHLVGFLAHLQFISKIHPTGYDTNLFSGKTNLRMSAEDSKILTFCHSRLFVSGNSGDKNDPTVLSDMEPQHFQLNTDRCKREVNYYFYVPYPEQRGLPELPSRSRHGGAGKPALISVSGRRAGEGRTSIALYRGQMKEREERWVGGSESQARWGDGSE